MRLQLDPDDDEAESKLMNQLIDQTTSLIEKSLQEWFRDLSRGLGLSVNSNLYDDLEERLLSGQDKFADVLRRSLGMSSDLGIQVAVDQLSRASIGFDWTLVHTRAREEARRHAAQLVTQITETTRTLIRETVARHINSRQPRATLIRDLRDAGFSARRAKLIAATEVTGAFARANQQAYQASGVVEFMEWRTARDERVCPICGSLHGRRAQLGELFDGRYMPPAHPGCRCGISPIIYPPGEGPANEALAPDRGTGPTGAEVRAQLPTLVDERLAQMREERRIAFDQKWELREQMEQPGLTPKQLADLTKAMEAAAKRSDDLLREIFALEDNPNKLIREFVQSKTPLRKITDSFELEPTQSVGPAPAAAVQVFEKGWDEFAKLVDDGLVFNPWQNPATPTPRTIPVPKMIYNPGRAYYDETVAGVRFSESTTTTTMVHEFGHWLESRNPEIHRKAKEFLARRTQGETAVTLDSLFPNRGYEAGEITKPDKFISPYIGKVYANTYTEVMSMGLQYMYEDPVKFAREDPDMFDFIFDTLRGR